MGRLVKVQIVHFSSAEKEECVVQSPIRLSITHKQLNIAIAILHCSIRDKVEEWLQLPLSCL